MKKYLTERAEVPDGENEEEGEEEYTKAINKHTRPERFMPIFAVRKEEMEELAGELDGTQIADDNWYYGFDGVVSPAKFLKLKELFGNPMKPENALAQIKRRAEAAAQEGPKEQAKLIAKEMKGQFGNLNSNPCKRNGGNNFQGRRGGFGQGFGGRYDRGFSQDFGPGFGGGFGRGFLGGGGGYSPLSGWQGRAYAPGPWR